MEQEHKNMQAEKDLLHRNTDEVITKQIVKTSKWLNLTDRIVGSVELGFLDLVMKVIQDFAMWCKQDVFQLKTFQGERVRERSGQCEERSDPFSVE